MRVIELAAWVAGPAAAGVLADWGADVIKVEPASGEPQRDVFGKVGVGEQTTVSPFELDNRAKHSVALDLRSPAGAEAMDRLLAGADVFVTNIRLAALGRLGLGHVAVRPRRPRLIHGIITATAWRAPTPTVAGTPSVRSRPVRRWRRRSSRRAPCRRRSAGGSAITSPARRWPPASLRRAGISAC